MKDNKSNYEYMVCTRCMTYNHSLYIEDTLKGFSMQETTFPVVFCVVDDASTDNEANVLREWASKNLQCDKGSRETRPAGELIVAPLRNNSNLLFVIFLLSENHHGKKSKQPYFMEWIDKAKYCAICEGDDYWTDKGKLQKQVEFMEKNPDYSFCHTGFDWYYDEKGLVESGKDISEQNQNIINIGENLRYAILDGNRYRIQTLTTVIRTSCYLRALSDLSQVKGKFLMGDTQLWLQLMAYGKVFFAPEVTGVYRVRSGSACHPDNKKSIIRFNLSSCEMRVTMAERFSLGIKELKQFYHEYYRMLAKYYLYNRDYQPFIEKKYCGFIDNIVLIITHNPITNRIIRKLYDVKNRQ